MFTTDIEIADFDYSLPDNLIARHPLEERDSCRLLLSAPGGEIYHRRFYELPSLLPPRTLLVCNNTKVINARIKFQKTTGAEIEIFCLEPKYPAEYNAMFQSKGPVVWNALVGNRKRWKEGRLEKRVILPGQSVEITLGVRIIEEAPGNSFNVEFEWDSHDVDFGTLISAAGFIPIPPYLNRESQECDSTDYQTIYSRVQGSVAAPTAGLHFTSEVIDEIRGRGMDVAELTLHVGAGTFQPVKAERIGEHPMHEETFSISSTTVAMLSEALREKRPISAVGTTTVRTLESLYTLGCSISKGLPLHVRQWDAYSENASITAVEALDLILQYMDKNGIEKLTASTSIMIAPGFPWHITDALITNFHQPRSTLLLLVSSFLERQLSSDSKADLQWRKIYDAALREGYRFLSYGDACLLFPRHFR